jgi:hypothetical protein
VPMVRRCHIPTLLTHHLLCKHFSGEIVWQFA